MTPLVEIKFGSHLYGTATKDSDLDVKAVHLPGATELLLQRAPKVVSSQTKADRHAKNTADDVDYESFSLQRFLGFVAEGQTVALDMLFAPDFSFMSEPHAIWREIQANKDRLLTRRYAAFVGYCRTQANRYGIRGSRVAASRAALTLLAEAEVVLGTAAKLREIAPAIEEMTAKTEHMALVDQTMQSGVDVRHWEVCGRKMPYTASIKSAHEIVERIVKEYGHRALQAERNEGVDWKAVSHAVRIGRQAIEVLETGNVAFPRADAAHLLAIKTGQLPYAVVSEEIEQLLAQIEVAAGASSLPESPDFAWIDDLVSRSHRDVILAA